jgi:hypothetical protein
MHIVRYSAEIMIRRPYLPYVIRATAPDAANLHTLGSLGAQVPWATAPHLEFWRQCASDMGARLCGVRAGGRGG